MFTFQRREEGDGDEDGEGLGSANDHKYAPAVDLRLARVQLTLAKQ